MELFAKELLLLEIVKDTLLKILDESLMEIYRSR